MSIALLASLISGYAFADVFHPEDSTIRGHIGSFGDDVCFNNDGSTNSVNCPDNTIPNEGYLYASGGQWRTNYSGLNFCMVSLAVVNPVSSATCSFVSSGSGLYAPCTPDNYVLVQTILRGHYFAVKAGATCSLFSRPENEVIFPCLSTDVFDPALGCFAAVPKPTSISVKDGYIKLDTIDAPPSTNIDCDDVSHEGRMVVDSVNDLLYICTANGWKTTLLN